MNTLGYSRIDDDELGPAFELLIDGQPVSELIDAPHTPIPCWYFEDDLPSHWPEKDPSIKIVAVCSCGCHGCGRTLCRVVRDGDTVVFSDFEGDLGSEKRLKEFRFSLTNYNSVISDIVKQASEHKGRSL
jgi:co-chaperonin GroES (HSP10)